MLHLSESYRRVDLQRHTTQRIPVLGTMLLPSRGWQMLFGSNGYVAGKRIGQGKRYTSRVWDDAYGQPLLLSIKTGIASWICGNYVWCHKAERTLPLYTAQAGFRSTYCIATVERNGEAVVSEAIKSDALGVYLVFNQMLVWARTRSRRTVMNSRKIVWNDAEGVFTSL